MLEKYFNNTQKNVCKTTRFEYVCMKNNNFYRKDRVTHRIRHSIFRYVLLDWSNSMHSAISRYHNRRQITAFIVTI